MLWNGRVKFGSAWPIRTTREAKWIIGRWSLRVGWTHEAPSRLKPWRQRPHNFSFERQAVAHRKSFLIRTRNLDAEYIRKGESEY